VPPEQRTRRGIPITAGPHSVHFGLIVGVTAEDLGGTTAEDRAEVVSLVRAREALPPEARTLAERAATDGEF
jgi:hypothetical protein